MELWLDVKNDGNFVKVDETKTACKMGKRRPGSARKIDLIITWDSANVIFQMVYCK